MLEVDRRTALRAARSAVSDYARDPSDRNAAQVQVAFEAVKDVKQTMWREHLEQWLQSN